MKKCFLSILTFLYMMTASGFAMEVHYCMGEKVKVEFFSNKEDEKCGRCGMKEKKGGCCTDELKFYKISDSHKQINNDLDLTTVGVWTVIPFPVYNWQMPAIANSYVEAVHDPPQIPKPSRLIFHCIFRI